MQRHSDLCRADTPTGSDAGYRAAQRGLPERHRDRVRRRRCALADHLRPLVAPALDALAARTLHHAVAAMTLAVVGAAVSLGAYLSLPSSRRSMPSADCEKTILLETEPLLTKALPIEPTRRSSQLHLPVMMTLIGTGQAVNSMLLMLVATSTTSSFGLGLSSLGRAETFTALALFNIVFQLGLFDRIVKCMGSKRACAMLAFAYPLEIAVVALYIAGPTTHPWVPLGAMLAVSATASMSMCASARLKRR